MTHTPIGKNGGKIVDDNFQCNFVKQNWLLSLILSLKSGSWFEIDEKLYLSVDNCLATNRRQTIIWTNDDSVQWRMYVALGGDILKACKRQTSSWKSYPPFCQWIIYWRENVFYKSVELLFNFCLCQFVIFMSVNIRGMSKGAWKPLLDHAKTLPYIFCLSVFVVWQVIINGTSIKLPSWGYLTILRQIRLVTITVTP